MRITTHACPCSNCFWSLEGSTALRGISLQGIMLFVGVLVIALSFVSRSCLSISSDVKFASSDVSKLMPMNYNECFKAYVNQWISIVDILLTKRLQFIHQLDVGFFNN